MKLAGDETSVEVFFSVPLFESFTVTAGSKKEQPEDIMTDNDTRFAGLSPINLVSETALRSLALLSN